MIRNVIVGVVACGAVACGDLNETLTLDEATAESMLEQTPGAEPSELDAASNAEEQAFSGLNECRWEPTRSRLLERFDSDGDGRLSDAERVELRESLEELPPHKRRQIRYALGRRMARLKLLKWVYDADVSQSLDEDEKALLRADLEERCSQRASMMLEHFDEDGDGTLSDEELEMARDARRAAHRERFEERFDAADTDGDGVLSRDEREAAHEAHRERVQERREALRAQIDSDGDGALSDEERESARAWIRSGARF